MTASTVRDTRSQPEQRNHPAPPVSHELLLVSQRALSEGEDHESSRTTGGTMGWRP
jgi:hypothetical protein